MKLLQEKGRGRSVTYTVSNKTHYKTPVNLAESARWVRSRIVQNLAFKRAVAMFAT